MQEQEADPQSLPAASLAETVRGSVRDPVFGMKQKAREEDNDVLLWLLRVCVHLHVHTHTHLRTHTHTHTCAHTHNACTQ